MEVPLLGGRELRTEWRWIILGSILWEDLIFVAQGTVYWRF